MLIEYERYVRDKLTAEVGQIFVAGGREYILAGNLGNGAIGVVRRAKDRKTDEQVAIKFLAPELKYIEESSLDDIYARFRREGQRGAALNHEHLIKIIAYEENEQGICFSNGDGPCNPFIVMQYIPGTTLEHYIQGQKRMGPHFNFSRRTLYIAYAVADALAYLHERKIVHRDVKPANIFFTKGLNDTTPDLVKLGDFGVVKWGDFKASLTSGTITLTNQKGLGTWKYMSPEQATKPKEVTVRSDMYSLGITLFELFTNQIFPTQHHIFQIAQQRLQRTHVTGKLYELGLGTIHSHFEDLFKCIYDMFLTSPAGRPTANTIRGKLRYLLEVLYPDTPFE